MTKEQFETSYAEKSGVTVEWIHSQGLIGVPCDCDEEICQGWAMVSVDNQAELDRRKKTREATNEPTNNVRNSIHPAVRDSDNTNNQG